VLDKTEERSINKADNTIDTINESIHEDSVSKDQFMMNSKKLLTEDNKKILSTMKKEEQGTADQFE
jgi:hypothetical protein